MSISFCPAPILARCCLGIVPCVALGGQVTVRREYCITMDMPDVTDCRSERAPQASAGLAVRHAAAADAPAIVGLAADLGYPVESDTVRRRLATLPAGHVVFVATNQDRVVGWLHAFHGQSLLHGDRVQIAGLVVAADQQGRGVGGALLTYVERWALGRGVHALLVLSGADRHAAHDFYRNRGFQLIKAEQAFTKALPAR
ncbi:MAG TPA: GNAT family N-acetyltransferase [Micromonospora sp.]|nr:GNAT family N-acetyltransferase [Micromonospora sp.]